MLNRLTSETWVGGNFTQTRTYDVAGNLTSISDPYSTLNYGYNVLGRVTSIDNAGTPGAPHVVQTQTYDPVGNRTSLSATVNGVADFVNNYQFDALNREIQVTQSGTSVGPKRVDISYTPISQFATVKRYSDLAGTQLVVSSTYGYDAANQLTSLVHNRGNGTPIDQFGYQYDIAGRMTQMTSLDGIANYGYDAAGQVTSAAYSYQAPETFTWDPNGNPAGPGHVIGPDNRLLSDGVNNYQYDGEGNRISQTNISTAVVTNYQWDYRNRLVDEKTQAGGTTVQDVSNVYDAFDRRIGKTVSANNSTVSEQFVYNGLGVIEAFERGSLTNRYLQGPGLDNVFADEQFRPGLGSSTLWTLGDHLGSVRDVVDNNGVVQKHVAYSAFGQTTIDTNPAVKENFRFAGAFTDQETGKTLNWKRWTDPATMNFMSQDPLGFGGGDANQYRDVGNNPIQATDPTGLHIVVPNPQDLPDLIIRLTTGNAVFRGLQLTITTVQRLDGKTIISIVYPDEIKNCQDPKEQERLKQKFIQEIIDKNKDWISQTWIRQIFAASQSPNVHIQGINGTALGTSALFPYPVNPNDLVADPIEFLYGDWDITIAVDNISPIASGHAWIIYTNRRTGDQYSADKYFGNLRFYWNAQSKDRRISASRTARVTNPQIYRTGYPSCADYASYVWYQSTGEFLWGRQDTAAILFTGVGWLFYEWLLPMHPAWLQARIYYTNGGSRYGWFPGYVPPDPEAMKQW